MRKKGRNKCHTHSVQASAEPNAHTHTRIPDSTKNSSRSDAFMRTLPLVSHRVVLTFAFTQNSNSHRIVHLVCEAAFTFYVYCART